MILIFLSFCLIQFDNHLEDLCDFRYTRIVGREGRDKLEQLYSTNPAFYETALPPLPYGKASQKYCDKFKEIMGIVASGKDEQRVMRMLDSQTLWDASMAHSIAKVMKSKNYIYKSCD